MLKEEYLVINKRFVKEIAPFEWVINEHNVSAIKIPTLNHMKELFEKHQKDGYVCCGYDWCTLIIIYIDNFIPTSWNEFCFDPSDDEVYISAKNFKSLKTFALSFRTDYDNPEIIEQLMESIDYRD